MSRSSGEFVIIGGGAAGIFAGIAAGRAGVRVRILEKTRECGRKILVSGNSHCNFSNVDLSPDFYLSSSPDFVQQILSLRDGPWLRNFFEDLGIPAVADRFGRLLPRCNEAASIRRVLLNELARVGVVIETNCAVTAITRQRAGFVLETDQGPRHADRLLLSAGSAAWPKLGTTGDGFRLAGALGHSLEPCQPALVPIQLSPNPFFSLQGIRMDCRLSVSAGSQVWQRTGEVQFSGYGLTGPVPMDASLPIGRWKRDESPHVTLDLLPDLPENTEDWLPERLDSSAGCGRLDDFFIGLLPMRLVERLLPGLIASCSLTADQAVRNQDSRQLHELITLLREWPLQVKGTRGYDEARTESGGILPTELNPDTCESRLVPGLYLAGEILDITGFSGGYNLHFAFASGHMAGTNAAEKMNKETQTGI